MMVVVIVAAARVRVTHSPPTAVGMAVAGTVEVATVAMGVAVEEVEAMEDNTASSPRHHSTHGSGLYSGR